MGQTQTELGHSEFTCHGLLVLGYGCVNKRVYFLHFTQPGFQAK